MAKLSTTDELAEKMNRANRGTSGFTLNLSPTSGVQMLDIDLLVPHPQNFYELSDIPLLADSIDAEGLLHNLVVAPVDGGKYEVISGHRRLEAVKMLLADGRRTEKEILCKVIEAKGGTDRLIALIELNATSRVLSDAEKLKQYEIYSKIVREAKEDGSFKGRAREHIAERLKISTAKVARLETIEKRAVAEVKQAVSDGKMSIATASVMSRLEADEQRDFLNADEPIKKVKVDAKVKSKKVVHSEQLSDDCEPQKVETEKLFTVNNFSDGDDEEVTLPSVADVGEDEPYIPHDVASYPFILQFMEYSYLPFMEYCEEMKLDTIKADREYKAFVTS